MPSGYHSATKPGSDQLDVPTRMRPAMPLTLPAAPAEAVRRRHDRAEVVRILLGAPCAARLDVAHLADGHVRTLEPPHRLHDDVRDPVALLELPLRSDDRLRPDGQPVPFVHRRRHDEIYGPELVLEQHERDAVRRRRPLPRDDEPGQPHPRPRSDPLEIDTRRAPAPPPP